MSEKSPITTHILDTGLGKPASGITVTLEYLESGKKWVELGEKKTNSDGRVEGLLEEKLKKGCYRLKFDTGAYFKSIGEKAFYPEVGITFEVTDLKGHHHVPLLLNCYGYTTYRGS